MKSSQHLHPLHHSCCASLFHCASHASTTRCLEIGFSRKQVLVILVPRTVVGINASSGASIGKGKHLPRPGKFLFRGGYDQLVPAKGWVLKEFDPSSNFLTKALARESVAFSFPGSVARWRCVRTRRKNLGARLSMGALGGRGGSAKRKKLKSALWGCPPSRCDTLLNCPPHAPAAQTNP
jgi:hypothetical protein